MRTQKDINEITLERGGAGTLNTLLIVGKYFGDCDQNEMKE